MLQLDQARLLVTARQHRDFIVDDLAEVEKVNRECAHFRLPAADSDTGYLEVAQSDDVDVVVTACYTSENVDLVEAAAKAGKHVVSVKPIAMTVAAPLANCVVSIVPW